MLLNEFPDLGWLKHQIQTRFENRRRWDGQSLPNPGWPNVILQVKTSSVYRNNITGPFSLFGNLSGSSMLAVDNRKVKVDHDHFFIFNAGQSYTLEVEKREPAETFNVHFGEFFSDRVIQSLSSTPENLLSQPFTMPSQSFAFHNRFLRKDTAIRGLITELQQCNDPMLEEEKLVELFTAAWLDEQSLTRSRESLPTIKRSTKDEIMKRILLSVDYVYSFYNRPITLEELADASCLSKFHFLRLFKIAMGETPHQFITKVRLEKAKELLLAGLEVGAIARLVGFDNSSSFSRLFYTKTGVYPTQFVA